MFVRGVLSDKMYRRTQDKFPVPTSRNINDVSGLYHLQQSLITESCVKMFVRGVLSDRYR